MSYARASLAEVETQLEISWRLGYADESGLAELMTLIDRLGRKLNRFEATIVKKART